MVVAVDAQRKGCIFFFLCFCKLYLRCVFFKLFLEFVTIDSTNKNNSWKNRLIQTE